MDLSIDQIDHYLRRIFSRSSIETIDDLYIVFRMPDNFTRMRAFDIYNKAYEKACVEGILPKVDLEKLIDDRNIITIEDKLNLSRLESKLEAQKKLLVKTTKVQANQDRIKKLIADLSKDIYNIKHKKASRLLLSAEAMAEERRYDFLCALCTYKDDGKTLYWGTLQDFMEETNIELKHKILSKFVEFFNGIPTNIIRYIARSNLWRVRYINSIKTSDPLFGLPASDYSDDMLNLVFWSNYYQNIYEMLPTDRPSESVIDDDDALDAYMSSYYEERENNNRINRQRNKAGNSMSAFDREEVIVTRFNELYEDIKYDKPRESQRVKDKSVLKKRTRN